MEEVGSWILPIFPNVRLMRAILSRAAHAGYNGSWQTGRSVPRKGLGGLKSRHLAGLCGSRQVYKNWSLITESWGVRAMRRLQAISAFMMVFVVLASVRSADAQRFSSRSSFTRPTLSPWLNLYRRDSGPLDNYHTFVRPEQRLRRTLEQQRAGIQRQNAAIHSLGRQVSRLERPSGVRPTGTGGTFMNYLHYYQMRGSLGPRR